MARRVAVTTAVLAAAGLSAGPAAAITISSFSVTPTTTAAGAHPDLTVSVGLGGGSIKNLVLHLPAGLLGNPLAAMRCSQSDFAAEQCQAASIVGSSSVSVAGLGLIPLTVSGPIFDLQPAPGEPALLGLLLRALPLTLPTDVLLQSPVSVRTSGDYGLDATASNLPQTVDGLPLTIKSLSLTLNGAAAGGPFVRNPTSCVAAVSGLDIQGYDGTRASASSVFTPTNCSALAFSPHVGVSIGGRGRTAKRGRPTFDSVVTQPPGQAGIASVTVTLPSSTFIDLSRLSHACPYARLTAGRCSRRSQFGLASAATPLLTAPLAGPVYLVRLIGGGLPELVAQLGGAIPVTLVGAVTPTAAGISTTFSHIPDVPISRFELQLVGGRGGLLENALNLCRSKSRLTAKLKSYSGKTTKATITARVNGCRASRRRQTPRSRR